MSKKQWFSGVLGLLFCLTGLVCPVKAVQTFGPEVMIEVTGEYGGRNSCLSPRAVQLNHSTDEHNGKMYTTFEYGVLNEKSQQVFPVYESTDEGRTWTKISDIEDRKNGWGMGNCPHLFELPEQMGELPAGTVICIGNSIPLDLSKTSMDMYYSTDQCRTWKYMSTIATGGVNIMGFDPIWEPFILWANGKLICYYSDETDPQYAQKLVHKTTTDGIHWSELTVDLAWEDPGMRPGMPIVAQMENGHYIMVYESVGLDFPFPVNYKISLYPNDPEQWDVGDLGKTYGYGGSPYIMTMDDGTIVATASDTGDLFVNTEKDATGAWVRYPCPVPTGYNRQVLQLSNGNLFVLSCGFPDQGAENKIQYTSMDLKSMLIPAEKAVYLTNRGTGKYLCIGASSKEENAAAIQWGESLTLDQKWLLNKSEDGVFLLENANSRLLLTAAEDGGVVQAFNVGDTAQKWKLELQTDGSYQIVNVRYGTSLSVTNEDPALLQEDTGAQNQRWDLTAIVQDTVTLTVQSVDGGTVYPSHVSVMKGEDQYFLIKPKRGYVLKDVLINGNSIGAKTVFRVQDVQENTEIVPVYEAIVDGRPQLMRNCETGQLLSVWQKSMDENAPLIDWVENGGMDQYWRFEQLDESGRYLITNVYTGKVLTAEEANVVQKTNTGDLSSQWVLSKNGDGVYRIENAAQNMALTLTNDGGDCLACLAAVDTTDQSQLWDLEYVLSQTPQWASSMETDDTFYRVNEVSLKDDNGMQFQEIPVEREFTLYMDITKTTENVKDVLLTAFYSQTGKLVQVLDVERIQVKSTEDTPGYEVYIEALEDVPGVLKVFAIDSDFGIHQILKMELR